MVGFSSVLSGFFLVSGGALLVLAPFCSCFVLTYSLWLGGPFSVELNGLLDVYGVLFMSAVFLVSGAAFIFVKWYMNSEMFYSRFVWLVVLFVSSMVFLIIIPNLITLLIGWDGLGMTSFLLVVYYQTPKSMNAGMLTALMNRIGDVIILVVVGLWLNEGSWLIYENCVVKESVVVGMLLIVGMMTKSAQMPFSSWLPAAMAAPTPVSALVHSSTLVTAGVYVLFRCSYLLYSSEYACFFLKVMSLLTLVMAGSSACMEMDIKKVIALSTLSQLSLMMFSLSIGWQVMAFFHLVSHAFFKALLFLCAGVVIHSENSWQDVRSVGKKWSAFPVSMSCLVVASMSLCGLPFLSGFYSKDLIIELSFVGNESFFLYLLEGVGVLFSVFYSLRVITSVLLGFNIAVFSATVSAEPSSVKLAVFSLLISSVVQGWVLSMVLEESGVVINVFNGDKSSVLFGGIVPFVWYWLHVKMCAVGWRSKSHSKKYEMSFISSMWHLKYLSAQVPAKLAMSASDLAMVSLETGWLEKLGPQGAFEALEKLVKMMERVSALSFRQVASFVFLVFFGWVFLLSVL